MLKSIAKSAPKREREEEPLPFLASPEHERDNAEDNIKPRTTQAVKKAKTRNGSSNNTTENAEMNTTPIVMNGGSKDGSATGSDASFITSSVKRSKRRGGEENVAPSPHQKSVAEQQLRFVAAANSAKETPGKSSEEEDGDVTTRLRNQKQKRSASISNTNTNVVDNGGDGGGFYKRGRKRFMDSIFSPMFSFLSSPETNATGTNSRQSIGETETHAAEEDAKRNASGARRTASRLGSKKHSRLRAITPHRFDKETQNERNIDDDDDGVEGVVDEDETLCSDDDPQAGTDMDAILSGFTVDTDDEEAEYLDADDEYDEEFDPWAFIFQLPPLSECVPKRRKILLPSKKRGAPKNTLVLDLDETLVHSNLEDEEGTPDFTFPVKFNNEIHAVNVRVRPHLQEFIRCVSEKFEVVIFTASQKVYADKLLDQLDPDRIFFSHRLFRDSCVLVEGNYLKDLSILGRDLNRTIIIDNSPQAFGFQIENGIPIESWYDDPTDEHLLRLLPVLDILSGVSDVKPILDRTFELRKRTIRADARVKRWRTRREYKYR